jgi:hypothetical protein
MSGGAIDVLGNRPFDAEEPSVPARAAGPRPTVAHGRPSREPLLPRRGPGTPGGAVPSDDDLLERTLAFSGSFVSDDGNVTIRRSGVGSFAYSGDRFVGQCAVCSRALLIPRSGQPLSDVRAAVQFVAAHDHGDVD